MITGKLWPGVLKKYSLLPVDTSNEDQFVSVVIEMEVSEKDDCLEDFFFSDMYQPVYNDQGLETEAITLVLHSLLQELKNNTESDLTDFSFPFTKIKKVSVDFCISASQEEIFNKSMDEEGEPHRLRSFEGVLNCIKYKQTKSDKHRFQLFLTKRANKGFDIHMQDYVNLKCNGKVKRHLCSITPSCLEEAND